MKSILSTAPAAEPVSSADLKSWMRVDGTADDALIASLGTSARQQVENYLDGKVCITQGWRDFYDGCEIPIGAVQLSRGPVSGITSVSYRANKDDTNLTTWDSGNYTLDASTARALPVSGTSWPVPADPQEGGFCIEYQAGYGTNGSSVPEQIRTAIKVQATENYENRLSGDGLSPAAMAILSPFRKLSV